MNEFVARNGLIALDSSSISGPLTVSGRLGIGTTTPSYSLDVNGIARVGASGASGQLYIKGFAGSGQYIYLDDGSTVWSMVGGSSYNIQKDGNNLFTINASNNVGINTSSPTARLDVRGNISSSGNFTIGGNIYKSVDNDNLGLYGGPTNSVLNGFIKINGQNNNWGRVQINIGYEPTNSKGVWTLNDSTELMTLTGRGNLGIGTPSPITTLDVRGGAYISSSTGVLLRADGLGLQNILFVSSSGNIGINTNSLLYGSAANSAGRLTINNSSGNNGLVIRNADDGYALSIKTTTNDAIGVQFTWYNGATQTFLQHTGTVTRIGTNAAGYSSAVFDPSVIQFLFGTSEVARLTSGGNLGIGTTSPIYSLDVLSPTGTEPLTTNTDNYAARIKRTYTNTSGSVSSRRYNTFFETTYTGNQAYTNANGLNNYINYQNTNANSVIVGMSSYIEPVSTVSASSLTNFAAQVGTGGSITSVTGYNSNLLSLTAGTTTNARLFRAEALGSTNTVTNLYGFIAESTLTSATNNYGFYGNIAAATGRWNLYMNGTANNYLAGNLGIGVTSPAEALHIKGNLKVQTVSTPDGPGIASIILNPEVSTTATIQTLTNFGPTSATVYSAGFKFITRNRDASLANPYYDVDAMSILANGSVGIGIFPFSGSTSPLSASLEVGIGNLIVNGFCSIGKISPGGYGAVGSNYYLDSSGNLRRKNTDMVSIMDMPTAGFRWLSAGVAAANSIISTTQLMILNNAGNLGIGITSPTYRLDINGSFRATGSITATSGSDYFDISHDITQPAQTGSQIYEVNITPTLRYTAPNQTQTALRVAATFSGSTALSSSQSNIIADFGSTSAGSQLVINDTTSGSIYMVNDVSGLPIIEANSNWDVFIYDYPNVVLKKTGSTIEVSGSLRLNGSSLDTAWTSYTPQWTAPITNPALNNGTITGAYKLIGKTCFVRVRLVIGSTTTLGSGQWYFSLPFSASVASGIQFPCSMLDNGNAWYQGTVNGEYGGFTDKTAIIGQSSGSNSSQGIEANFPIAWGTSDTIQFNGSYEIA